MNQHSTPAVIDQCETCGESVTEVDVTVGLCPFCHQPLERGKLKAD